MAEPKKEFRKLDTKFCDEIARQDYGKEIKKCIQCGTCSSGCLVESVVPGFNPRKIIAKALLGMRKEVLGSEEIWECARCYICTAHCKKNIRPGDVIKAIRMIAIKEGHTNNKGARHAFAFYHDIKKYGKLNEAMLPFNTQGVHVLKMTPFAVKMILKGKSPSPVMKKIKDIKQVEKLYELLE